MPFQVGHTINEGRHTKAGVKRVRAAFVRLYDADPAKLDSLAIATHRKAVAGDVAAATFIRDTLGEKPALEIEGDSPAYAAWLAWVEVLKLAGDTKSISPQPNDINGLDTIEAQVIDALPALDPPAGAEMVPSAREETSAP